jgi:hypothetical protein
MSSAAHILTDESKHPNKINARLTLNSISVLNKVDVVYIQKKAVFTKNPLKNIENPAGAST